MSSEKTEAIILRVVPFSESSVVLTMLTRDFGKISALAKGAYRPKSAFEGAIDLGCHCRVVFIKKSSDALDLLTEAKLERRFRAANKSLQRLYVGYYILELLRELTESDEPHPDLFELALWTLRKIDSADLNPGDLLDLVATFELQALKHLGHAPSMDVCATCGKTVGEMPSVPFGMISGGVLCLACRPISRQVVMLSKQTRDAMRQRINGPPGLPAVNQTQKSQRNGELRGVLRRYMSHHVGHELKMPRLIDGIGGG
ncbi:DNA repair protein RecO [Rosistilla carotiformis]|uniref:DNA repair protein RecO n=1 Tax=Rosistilla carotiformis TaxID=2528017 RepID=A0A518JXZ4_9BACT|nr:DNA repair protein RecO [Rosistilla carotiformis]QDV70411.1 DNA repair protein RecO [Rosistilla carotiformis]